MLLCVIHDSTTTVMANLIFLAKISTPDLIIQNLEQNITSICPLLWSTGLTQRKLPRKCTKSVELHANKAQKIKCAYHCTYRQVSNGKVLLILQILEIAVICSSQFQCTCRNNKTALIKHDTFILKSFLMLAHTHWEKVPSNKTAAIMKTTKNMVFQINSSL